MRICAFAFFTLVAATAGLRAADKFPPGYRLEKIATPPGVAFACGGLQFARDGALYACTRTGDLWVLKPGGKDDWHVFARGLQEPLGVLVDKQPGHVFVCQRTELTELIDEDGDGVADVYRRVNGDWGFSGNYHEFAHGPVRDSKGNFYLSLNLGHGGPGGVQKSVMTHPAHHRGWVVQITPDGKFVPYACGFRSPDGIALDANDDLWIMDSQGDWVATSPLFHVVQDRFYLHPSSLADRPDFAGKNLDAVPTAVFDKMRSAPVFWVPYGELANSPGQPVFDVTKGKFGPFAGQMFFGDQTKSNVMRAAIEKVDGEWQGAVFNFGERLASGYIRGTFAPDGSFWMAEVDHGWSTSGGKPWALERLVWDGRTVPFEIAAIHVTAAGFQLAFTSAVDPKTAGDPASYKVKHWHYEYHAKYGSDKMAETTATVEAATVAADAKSVELKLPLLAGEVYQISAPGVKSASNESLANATGWYTLNRLQK